MDDDLGLMFYDAIYERKGNVAVFFPARLQGGVLDAEPERVLADAELRGRLLAC